MATLLANHNGVIPNKRARAGRSAASLGVPPETLKISEHIQTYSYNYIITANIMYLAAGLYIWDSFLVSRCSLDVAGPMTLCFMNSVS